MPRLAALIVFAAVAFGITAGIHYYFWLRLVRDTALPPPWRAVATVALIALAVSIPATFAIGRGPWKSLVWPGYVWMGMMLLLLVALLGADAIRLVARALRAAPDPERRLALRRLLGGAAAAVAGGLGLYAVKRGLAEVAIRDVEVALAKLPPSLAGTTIVQMTDVHVGPTIGRAFIEDLVAKSNALAPDVVAITGDLADGSVADLADAVAPLANLKARHGVYFVTGNHEYYSGVHEWLPHLQTLGIRVLRNERVTIGDGAAAFDLAGIDDHSSRGQAPGHGPDLDRALADRDPSRALVLLAHQPKAIHEAARAGVGLQLSGHTHGGQIWPWGWLVRLQQPYVAGLVRHGDTHLYVSHGTGYWGPPMRLGTTAEITRVVLKPA